MRSGILAIAIALALNARAMSETVPVRGITDSRVRTVTYDGNEVYRIHGYPGFEIDLQFEVGESFVGLGAGDIDGLAFVSQDNHLFIKPRVARVDTNLTVLTTRRSYQFAYSVAPSAPAEHDADVIFAVRFDYPRVPPDDVAAEIDRALAGGSERRSRNLHYGYCGSASIKPVMVADDGVHTRLRFGAKSEQPAIFVLNDDGSESLLNYSMDKEDIVIHRVVRQMVVRRGRLVGRIVNTAFDGSGDRLKSHTLSPRVERRVEARP